MIRRKIERSTNSTSIDLTDIKPSNRLPPKLLHLFLLFITFIAMSILILLIFAMINLSQIRNEINAASDQAAKVIAQQMTKLYAEMVRTPSNIRATNGKSQSIYPDEVVDAASMVPPIKAVAGIPSHTSDDVYSNDAHNVNRVPLWHDRMCTTRCKRDDIGRPPVVVISFDGFAQEYVDKHIVKTFDFIGECGASAKFIYPSYPSKTFPNHYSIVTGLYPESHGIVDNYVHAPEISPTLQYMPKTNDARYYKGEPVWVAAERSGLRSACLFWAGCSHNISGINPTYNMRYNRSFNFRQRIEKIVEWLSLPKEERPHLIMAYFNQPDTIGHFRQLEQELDAQLIELDHLLNDLFTSLYSKDLLNCINILIVSDHGMQKLERRYYLNEYINTTGMIISSGVIARIRLADSGITLDELKQHFRCSNNGTQYRIYDNMHIPKRYHYAHSDRIGDLILEGMPGVILFGDKGSDVGVVADHGYDYLADSMHAIFYARGPDIKPKSLIEPFQNVELFNLIIDLLGLPNIFPNNGTYGRLHEVLINPPKKITHRQSMQLYKCSANGQSRPPRMTSCDIGCEKVAEEVTSSLSACPSVPSLNVTGFYPDVISYCHVSLCPVTVLLSMSRLDAHSLTIYEPLSVIDMQPQRSEVQMCTFLYDQSSADCEQWNTKRYIATASQLRYHSLFTNTHSKYNNIDRVQTLLFDSFINGPFAHLQNLTQMCIRKYGRLMVITGNIFDYDNNGIADSYDVFRREVDGELLRERPSHIFRILLRCNDSRWSADNQTCRDVSETRALAFILPNVPDDLNCLEPMEYLFVNTARIRDIELLTGLEFFIDRNRYDENVAVRMRTYIQQNLWEC